MKLKYFMRGLGIGIILVTFIIALSGNNKEKLSDQEIIDRARSLGMVTEEESEKDLKQLLENDDAAVTVEPSVVPTELPTTVPTQTVTITPTPVPTKAPSATPVPTVTSAPEITITPTKVPVQQTEDTKPENSSDINQKTAEQISFTIKSGMTSGQVAFLLVEKGIIDDADAFNHYIEASGKASIIRVGTYALPKGSDYKDIVTKITTK